MYLNQKSKIYLAKYYAHQNDDKKALANYLEAIKINPKTPTSYEYLTAATIAFKLKNNKTAKKLLAQSISNQLAPIDFIKEFESLQRYKDYEEFKDVLAQYDDLENQYFRTLKNPKAYMEIQNLIAKDQLVRENDELFNKLARKTDSTNITELMELTKKYGWEKRGWVLLWHHRGISNDRKFVWDFFKPYLENAIKKDNVNKDFFVDFEEFDKSFDAYLNKESKGAIYTLRSLGNLNGNTEYYDIQNLDKRRKSVGLPPLYFEYFLDNNSELPEGYEYNPENLLKDLENL
ncbi:hypothetical protein ASG31_07545 [Chryseobacterium sp. Leaf404]|uniref:tetratricopeptide repeat protein n=1 Tax=unclassified Chryseobacterium TaxID=2593645 RepID=UPI0006F5810B|nr:MULTISPECIES: hypothetical protein [unclassified Chryseobacterium]KQT18561.1 hypothetical protein ASG31_07545 [Chryseobacterium sp. Leaf404]